VTSLCCLSPHLLVRHGAVQSQISPKKPFSGDQTRPDTITSWYIVCHELPRGKGVTERPKILVVDDDDVIRALFKHILEQAGAEVSLAQDGMTAVKIASEENPDLVIVDGLLPKMHGFLVCKEIKDRAPNTKVVIVTGIYTKLTYRWEVKIQYHADDLLQKPVAPAELLACIDRHLPGRLSVARPSLSSFDGQARSTQDDSSANSRCASSKEIDPDPVLRVVNL
jgi:CheY-like chemotaxis protein